VSDVDTSLRALFGLPPRVGLRWTRDPAPDGGRFGVMTVWLDIAGQELRLELLDGGGSTLTPWLTAEGLELRVAPPVGAKQVLTELAKRVGARFLRNADGRTLASLRDDLGVSDARTFDDLAEHHAREGWDIWHHLDGEREHNVGLLRLGFRCNQDCWFCWQGRSWPNSPEGGKERIDRLADQGSRVLTITGGEPTAFKELPDLVAHAVSRGMSVSLQTNAIGFSRPKLMARLMDAGLEAAFVSFHSADPEVSDAMTRAPGTWVHTVAGIKAALTAGVRVRLNCVVEQANVAGLPQHASFIRDELVPLATSHPLSVSYSHPSRYLESDTYADHVAPLDEVAPPLMKAWRILDAAGVFADLLGTCGFPPCVVQEVPGLLDRVRDVHFPQLHTVSRTAAKACGDCSLKDRCLGPRHEYLAVHGERGLRPLLYPPRRGDPLRAHG